MSEKRGMREAIDRVGLRIHEQAQKSGQSSTFEEARNRALDRAVSFEHRNPEKTRTGNGSKPGE